MRQVGFNNGMASNYRGNIGSLLSSNFAIYQREDHSKRVKKIVNRAGKSGNLPSLPDLCKRYSISEPEAVKLLATAKRRLIKLRKDALALEARVARRAMLDPDNYPPTIVPESVSAIDAELTLTPHNTPVEKQMTSAATDLGQILTGIRTKYGDEIRKRGEQTMIPEGFVYLVTHEVFSGWVKAGMTIDYELRMGTYNVADPLSRFRFAAIRWVPNRRIAESLLLERLASVAEVQSGEWFQVSVDVALGAFDAF